MVEGLSVTVCASASGAFPTALALFQTSLVCFGCAISWSVRDIKGIMAESKPIFLLIYTIAIFGGVILFGIYAMHGSIERQHQVILIAVGTMICSCVGLVVLLYPKVKYLDKSAAELLTITSNGQQLQQQRRNSRHS